MVRPLGKQREAVHQCTPNLRARSPKFAPNRLLVKRRHELSYLAAEQNRTEKVEADQQEQDRSDSRSSAQGQRRVGHARTALSSGGLRTQRTADVQVLRRIGMRTGRLSARRAAKLARGEYIHCDSRWSYTLVVKQSGSSCWYRIHGGVLDVRGRPDFSRFDPRPGRPHFSNFGPPTERRPFCENSPKQRNTGYTWLFFRCTRVLPGFEPWFSRHGARRPTLAGLVPICPRGHVSRFDPKVPHFSR